ncbi:MAG TPA: hypothetical protein VF883_12170 [Thermoanaerobaculia bacterium]|jgi:hypothetical protein
MTAIDDAATITRYLLHEAEAREQEEIERRYFSDPEYLALVEAVEGELIDAYVRGELPRERCVRFERYFLSTRARRERLRMAEAMQRHFARPARVRLRPILAVAAALVAVLGLGGWYFAARGRDSGPKPATARQEPAPEPLRVETPKVPVTIAATLMPGLTRAGSAPQKIVLRRDVDEVRLTAVVDVAGEWPNLRASLGRWTTAGLTMNVDRTVTILIPAAQLTEGEHVLVLTSGNEPIGDYAFVVEKIF